MASSLLATKLHLPAPPPRWVRRPRLTLRLNAGLDAGHKISLISAPAGFGKTTCISEWAPQAPLPVTWLSLDPSDNDAGRFFTYLAAALQKIDARLGGALAGSLSARQSLAKEVLSAGLINALAEYPGRFALVLDDFQVIQDELILGVFERLVANQPPALHLALITREDPPLPLARLRAHNQLTELRAEDLRFTAEEAGRFLSEVMDLCLSDADLSLLEARTEGWIVGLQLAGLSMRDRADPSDFIATLSGSHRFILSYLTEEVLSRQTPDIQQFLLETSILEKMNGPLCDALRGEERYSFFENRSSNNESRRTNNAARPSQEILAYLERSNLFLVPLDDEQHWYRYHHLFADLLANRLKQNLPEAAIQALHCRAGVWLAENDFLDEAIVHALLGEDSARAGLWIERAARTMMFTGRVNVLRGWLESLPEEVLNARLYLKIYRAWIDLLQGKADLSEPALLKMDEMLRALPPSPENNTLRKEMIVILSRWVALAGNTARAIATAQEALGFLPEDDLGSRARVYSALAIAYGSQGDAQAGDAAYRECLRLAQASANYTLAAHTMMLHGMWLGYYGRLHEAAAEYQAIIDMGADAGQKVFYPAGQGLIGLGSLYLEWNELEAADQALSEGMHLCSQAGLDGYFAGGIFRSRLRMARGDSAGALEELVALERAFPRSDTLTLTTRQVQAHLALGDIDGTSRLAAMLEGILERGLGYGTGGPPISVVELVEIILARVALARGEFEKAREYLARLRVTAEPGGRCGHLIEAGLLQALAAQKQAGSVTALALHSLEAALEMAEPEGYFLLFVEAGPEMAPLLSGVMRDPGAPERVRAYAGRLLRAIPGRGTLENQLSRQDMVEPLTERELEVLRLIAEGLKYEEIAERLFISLNTVRTYIKGIYGKLEVNSRSRAVSVAQQKKLI